MVGGVRNEGQVPVVVVQWRPDVGYSHGEAYDTMTKDQAVAMARRTAEEERWTWIDPPLATLRNGRWEVFSNGCGRGAVVRVVLDDRTGAVIEKGYIPR